MNKWQLVQWSRNDAVGSLLRNSPETASIPGWPAKLVLFDSAMNNLRAVAARQAQPVSTSKLRRDIALDEAVQTALKLSGIALSYAEENKLPLLANRVRLRPSAFNVVRPLQRVQLAQMVHDTLAPIVAQLADHGVTPAVLEAFQQQIDEAAAALPAPRDARVQRRAATEELREALRRVNSVLENHFDPLLLPLKRTHPEFYRRYRAARMIVNYPTRGVAGAEPAEAPAPVASASSPAEPKAA